MGNDGAKRPLPAACLVETSYETSSLILSGWKGEGWIRLSLETPCNADGEGLWSHLSLLGAGGQTLIAERWDTFFFRDDISPLTFRQDEIPHALRVGPDAGAARVTWIGQHHAIEPLEINGDWMRVRVHQPSNYCIAPEDWTGRADEGWIKWRDDQKGPWVFHSSRGC